MTRYNCVLLVAVFAFMISGCSDPIQTPLSSQSDIIANNPADGGYSITLSAKAPLGTPEAMRLTKPALRRLVASRIFRPGVHRILETVFEPYVRGDRVQLRRARLIVNKDGVTEPVEITMRAVSGTSLDDIVVIFQPDGFEFQQPATLVLRLLGATLTPEDIAAYHISGGVVDRIGYEYDEDLKRDVVVISMTVPGFSRYSLGGDR